MQILPVLLVVSAVGSGLLAGLFFVFSAVIMAALGRLPAPQGIAAMQSINSTILNPLFMLVFMGTTLLCAALAVFAFVDGFKLWLLVGALVLVVGMFLVTVAINVPMNNALDAVDAGSAAGAEYWQEYLSRWTAWNHVRTVACLGSMTTFVLLLRS